MPFTHKRTVCFRDTDAAGVVYFANVLSICHEAYEASLAASGINLKSFFSNRVVAIPISHASVDFHSPMFCGDQLLIHVMPKQLTNNKFEIAYHIIAASSLEQQMSKAITKHVCINPMTRIKTQLPEEIVQWLCCWSS